VALETKDEIGIAALAAVTVGGIVYYLTKNSAGNAEILQAAITEDKKKIVTIQSVQKMTPLDKSILDRQFTTKIIKTISKPVLPTFKEVSGFSNEPRMNSGLLGKLVAAYWAYAQTRLWYMTRCKQYHPFDDTPQWLARDAAHGGHDMDKAHYKELMKTDRGTWPIGVPRSFILNRFEGENPSKFNKYQRYNSLDLTFPNWSMPFNGFDCVRTQASLKHAHIASGAGYKTGCWTRCGWRRPFGSSHTGCVPAMCPRPLPTRWFADINWKIKTERTSSYFTNYEPFTIGKKFDGQVISNQLVVTRGYKYQDGPWEDDKAFAGIVEKNYYKVGLPIIGGYPGRIWGKVSASDRAAARYLIKVPQDFSKRYSLSNKATKEDEKSVSDKFIKELHRYYHRGYNLVNTCLDILIDRKHFDLEKEFPKFVKHCNWWWILPPNKAMLSNVRDKDNEIIRMPRFSDIGGGNMGLGDVTSEYLVSYVMKLTPPPGTIPPWEDKGPLWLWPSTAGQMTLIGAPTIPYQPAAGSYITGDGNYLRSSATNAWNSWNNMFEYMLAALNEAIYEYVMQEAGGAIAGQVTKTAAAWAENLGIDILEQLQDKLGGDLGGIMDLGSKVAAFAGLVENIDIADSLNKTIKKSFEGTALNTYDLLKKYLKGTVDGMFPDELRKARELLDTGMSELRSWGWHDDLIGELGSVGSRYGDNGIKALKSKYGYNVQKFG
jgi:hypothetical protein